MTKKFFTYRYRKDRKGNQYTPSYEWGDAYPEWAGLATIVDEQVQTSAPQGKRLGWIECDDTIAQEVEDELINYGKYGWLIYITPAEATLYMQVLTSHTEVEPGKFELVPAIPEWEIDWPQDAIYLNIA